MAVSTSVTQLSFSIIDPGMTVKAMRDSGYKSTTHALAELIDNSIESRATVIEVFGVSRQDDRTRRFTLKELAVLDNGEGMDIGTLRGSLRYGHGTRQERRGIGRFGLGLPNSSMSQARRVDVWSWQSGATNALHTWLSLDDVEDGASEIPEPEHRAIPSTYLEASRSEFGDSGTLVVWSHLDRVEWKQASTTFKHTELLIGRIYRRFLSRQSERLHPDDPRGAEIGTRRTITLIPIHEDDGGIEVQNGDVVEVRSNDPLYLMTDTSCPEGFGTGPMFTELEGSPFAIPVTYRYEVRVRASYARAHVGFFRPRRGLARQGRRTRSLGKARIKIWASRSSEHTERFSSTIRVSGDDPRERWWTVEVDFPMRAHVRDSSARDADWPEEWIGKDAGHAPWGKHADQNMGVSLVRAHREIQLDDSWVSGDDPRERWWTVEVAALDEVFGVTNNKQGTMIFQRLARYDWRREALPGEETSGDVRRRMEEDGDHRIHLLDLREQIERAIKLMRSRVRQARLLRGSRHVLDEDQKADAKATAAIKRRMVDGHEGESDKVGESGSEEEHREAQVESLTEKHHFDRTDALQQIDETIQAGNRVRWIQSAQSSPAFFDVESLPNVIQVALNTDHPVHSHLYDIMHPDVEDMTEDEVRERLARAAAAFRILIYSWARYEDEQTDKPRRQVRNARMEWGRYAEEFFDEDDDSVPPTDLV